MTKEEMDRYHKEIINQAKNQGATHYNPHTFAFWRPCPGGVEIASSTGYGLSIWQRDWHSYPPESAVRL